MSDADRLMEHAQKIREVGEEMDRLINASRDGLDTIDFAMQTRKALYTMHHALMDLSATAAKANAAFNLTVGTPSAPAQPPAP